MAVLCTLFSVSDADITAPSVDVTLPSIADRTSSTSAAGVRPHIVELGDSWLALHNALGKHGPEHPLGFLASGGEPFRPLEDGERSSGRYFTPARTIKLLAAVASVTEDQLLRTIATQQLVVPTVAELIRQLAKLRVFLAEAVSEDRGVIVHHIR